YDIVRGLRAAPDGIDNDGDGGVDEAGERIGMTNFVVPVKDGPRRLCCSGKEIYQALRSIWGDDSPVTFGGEGYGGDVPTGFMYPGMPPDYWSMENIDQSGGRIPPSDKRFLFSMGPVTMQPGEVQDFTLAIVWARGDDRYGSIRLLKAADGLIQMGVDWGLLDPDKRWLDVSGIGSPLMNRQYIRSGLGASHPNPVVGSSTIPFELVDQAHVRISVYDVLGRAVAQLVDEVRSAGPHEVTFDTDGLTPGVYFCRMEALGEMVTGKIIVME
ncbi:MAG: T9SS type A sorting domain-containing protein, partial [Rhodothermales bacterium]